MLLTLLANYTVHRLLVDGNWYETSFPLVYVRITFIHCYLPKIETRRPLDLQSGTEFVFHVIFVETARNSFGL